MRYGSRNRTVKALSVVGVLFLYNLAAASDAVLVIESLRKAKKSGAVILDPTKDDFDTTVKWRLKNISSEQGAIVEIPRCTYDQHSEGVIVLDLEQALQNGGYAEMAHVPGFVPQTANWRVCLLLGRKDKTHLVYIPPGGNVIVKMGIDFRATGKFQVLVFAKVYGVSRKDYQLPDKPSPELLHELVKSNAVAAIVPMSLYYNVYQEDRDVRFRRSTYVKLFLPGAMAEPAGGDAEDYDAVADKVPVAFQDYRICRPLPINLTYDPDHSCLDRIPFQSGGGRADPCDEEPENPCQDSQQLVIENDDTILPPGAEPSKTTYTVTGRFSVMWTDHTLHPGFGWRARAWWNDGGDWHKMAEDWVQSDGSFHLSFNYSGYSGQHLRVQFVAFNRYFQPEDSDGNTYRWKNPDRYSISTSQDEGHRYANCDGNDAHGLGELYDYGMRMWSRLYWQGGIDPLRDEAITVVYPNVDECLRADGSPWSCSDADNAMIWLIPEHALERSVMQHEMAHQLNNEFWDNKRPAGAGGPHTLTACENGGLALREGFANFIPFWVQHSDRSTAPNGADWFIDVEAPTACNNYTNESWVAACFWDLYDSHGDGADILWYVHRGAPIAIFLANGPANDGDAMDMRDFLATYQGHCTAGHEGFIEDIFEQNNCD